MFNFGRIQRRRAGMNVPRSEPLEARIVPSAINVTTTPGPGHSVDLMITGTSGDDDVQIYVGDDNLVHVYGRPDGSDLPAVMLNGAPAQQELVFAKLRNINMNLGAGNDRGVISDISAGKIVINDGVTADESNIYEVSSRNHVMSAASLRLNFDMGIVWLNLTSGRSIRLGSLAISLARTTSSHIQISTFDSTRLQVAGLFSIDSPDECNSKDHLIFYAASNATGDVTDVRFGNVRWSFGGGNDQIYVVGSMTFDGQTKIDSGSGNDSVEFRGGFGPFTGCPSFNGRVTVNTGGGYDVFGTTSGKDSTNRVNFFGPVVVITGDQKDYVYSTDTNFYSSLTVDLGRTSGTESDQFWSSDIKVTGSTVVRSSGLASVLLSTPTAGSRFEGNVWFSLGSGFIYVELGNEAAKVKFGGFHTFRGLSKRIDVYYFEEVDANPARRRLLNAVLH